MVAETPTEGRCNARVVDKVGLEVECTLDDGPIDDRELTLTDHDFDIVRLVGPGGSRIDTDANYESVRKFLWDDYEVQFVGITETVVDDDDDPVAHLEALIGETEWVDVVADDELSAPDTTVDIATDSSPVWFDVGAIADNTTNRTTEHQGFCERYEMDDRDHCYVHQGCDDETAVSNAIQHGMYAKRSNLYQSLSEENKQYVEALVDSWVQNAPFERSNKAMVDTLYRCAIDQLRAWFGQEEYVDDGGGVEGLVKEQEVIVDGDIAETEDENPLNMAYSRLTDDVRSELKDMGVYDSPEQQQADATQSLARKLSGLDD